MPSIGAGQMPENLAFGAALSSLSFFCTAVMSALVKATEELTSTAVVLLFQNLICLLVIIPITLHRGWASLRTDKIGLHILRAATGTAAWYALFVAITLMPLTNAILLTFSAPLWMPVIAWVVFRQRASTATWVGAGDRLRRCGPRPAAPSSGFQYRRPLCTGRRILSRGRAHVRRLAGSDRADAQNPLLLLSFLHRVGRSVRLGRLEAVRSAGIDLPDRYRVDAACGPGSHRSRIPLRVGGQGWSVHLHGHRFHRIDRLGHSGIGRRRCSSSWAWRW